MAGPDVSEVPVSDYLSNISILQGSASGECDRPLLAAAPLSLLCLLPSLHQVLSPRPSFFLFFLSLLLWSRSLCLEGHLWWVVSLSLSLSLSLSRVCETSLLYLHDYKHECVSATITLPRMIAQNHHTITDTKLTYYEVQKGHYISLYVTLEWSVLGVPDLERSLDSCFRYSGNEGPCWTYGQIWPKLRSFCSGGAPSWANL